VEFKLYIIRVRIFWPNIPYRLNCKGNRSKRLKTAGQNIVWIVVG